MPTIPDLPAAAEVSNADLFVTDDGATTSQATREQMLTAGTGEGIVLTWGTSQVGFDADGTWHARGPNGGSLDIGAGGSVSIGLAAGQIFSSDLATGCQWRITHVGYPFFVLDAGATLDLYVQLRTDQIQAATSVSGLAGVLGLYDLVGDVMYYLPLYSDFS